MAGQRASAARAVAAVVAVTAAILAAACGGKGEAPQNPLVTVDVAPVLSAAIHRTIRADGLLYPLQQAAIVPKITGPVRKVYVEKGARVKAGQLLLEIESQDLAGAARESQASYDLALANYETTARATVPEDVQKAELDVQASKDALDAQQTVFTSRQELFKQGAIAQKDVNDAQVALSQARTTYEVARKRLENLQGFAREEALKAAVAQRDAARARLESAQAQLGYARITSPIDGVVTDRPVYPGETPPSGSPVVTVMDVSQVIARAHIAQTEAALLKVGNEASLIGSDNVPIPAKVTQISPALDPAGTTVEVWVQGANPNGQLRPGSSLRVEMIAQTVPGALVIPKSAVITSASGSTSVIVIDAENKPHKTGISVGITEGDRVQVTDGLESGQRVVTTGGFELAKLDADVLDKTKVQIQPAKEEEEEDESGS